MLAKGEAQQGAFSAFAAKMRERLGFDEALSSLLVPKWGVGCRRLTPGKGFLEALIKENVNVVSSEIVKVLPEGVQTADGAVHKMDALVCATGFDTTFRPRFELRGSNGKDLREHWADTNDVEAYMGMSIAGYPNYFTYLGPSNPISNGTLIPVLEKVRAHTCSSSHILTLTPRLQQCDYFVKLAQKLQCEGVKAIEPKEEAVRELNIHHQTFMPRLVFSDSCRSWYKGGKADGKVIAIWPGSSVHYYDAIKDVRWEDYNYVYDSNNRFSYLGNGVSLRELEQDNDLAWYLLKPDQVLTVPDKPAHKPEYE